MEQVVLHAKKRTSKPRGSAGRIRRNGGVPGIYYGKGQENLVLELQAKEVSELLRHKKEKNLISLEIEGVTTDTKAVIKDMQKDVIRGNVLHIDFQHISMDTKITMEIPVETVGEAVGVKTSGGVLQIVHRMLHVECLPANLPQKITLDIANLDVGQSIQIRDIQIPGVTLLHHAEDVVATISMVKEEVVAAPTPEAAAAEPELAKTKGKKDEEGEGAAPAAGAAGSGKAPSKSDEKK